MRSEDGYNESLHILVANVQAGANGRAERDVAAEMLRDVARPDRRIPNKPATQPPPPPYRHSSNQLYRYCTENRR